YLDAPPAACPNPSPLALHGALPICQHRHHVAVLLDVFLKGIAHEPPAADIPHAGDQGEKSMLHGIALLSTSFYHNRSPINCTTRSEEHTSELQSRFDLVCRLLL